MNLKKVEDLYSENIKKFGVDSRSVGWNSPESQNLRFEKLSLVIEMKTEAFTINELGCGYGEFLKYLDRNDFSVSRFRGYDISSEMLDAASTYLAGENSRIELHKKAELDTEADYSFTSGIFNVKFEEDEISWIRYIENTILNLNKFSKKGFAFNLLTSYVDFQSTNLFYADPHHYFDFCKKHCSRFVTLVHDYALYEWTILVKK